MATLSLSVNTRYKEIRNQNTGTRLDIVKDLGNSRRAEDELLLIYLTDDSAWNVRVQVLEALRSFHSPLARLAVKAFLADPIPLVRAAAIDTLGQIGTTQDVPWLVGSMKETSWALRSSAALSMGLIGGRKARKVLMDALVNDSDAVVRRDAAHALSRFKDQENKRYLTEALERESQILVRLGLLFSLYKLGDTQHLETFLKFLQDKDALIRDNVVNTIDVPAIATKDRQSVIRKLHNLIEIETHAGVRGDAEMVLKELNFEDK